MYIPVIGELAFLARNFFGWMVNAPQMNAPDGVSYMVTLIGITIGSTVSVNVTTYCPCPVT